MQKKFLLGILIVIGLVMISTTFSITPIVAQSETDNNNMTSTDNNNMTSTDNNNMTSTDNNNMTQTGQISKRH
jgi:hypothetical protein